MRNLNGNDPSRYPRPWIYGPVLVTSYPHLDWEPVPPSPLLREHIKMLIGASGEGFGGPGDSPVMAFEPSPPPLEIPDGRRDRRAVSEVPTQVGVRILALVRSIPNIDTAPGRAPTPGAAVSIIKGFEDLSAQ
jgi:hypothetical protein